MDLLHEIEDQTDEPEKIAALLHILDHDLGYHLYRAVERAKVDLSSRDETLFHFEDAPLVIDHPVTRSDFEGWISEERAELEECVDRLVKASGVSPGDIDQVFMTGGTSFVPAVRRIFDQRFGAGKIRAGGEMISVATGLALRARNP